MFSRILIANRGEIALRIIRACHELGVETVAVYSEADADAIYLRHADDAICIGPAPSAESYLHIPAIIAAAEIADVEAIHPGYGFLAENAHFAEVCASCNIEFIGPKPSVIAQMGDKAEARKVAHRCKLHLIPGSGDIVKSVEEALTVAREVGYPVVIKAASGGGGRGMRLAHNDASLTSAFHQAQSEAEIAFGNSALYVEKQLTQARHIEIQLLADHHGSVIHLGERDCSLQRRYQKLIEEAPSPVVSPQLREKMGDAAKRLAHEVNYTNAGTVEFLLDEAGNFYFMEMNTRVQVEHPVTEMVTGVDIIKEQIRIACGQPLRLKQSDVKINGVAIECRINAEDSENGFKPCPGTVGKYYPPGGVGVRLDSHVYSGYTIPPTYDSMVGKLIVHRRNRESAISCMRRALSEFVFEDIKTTIPLYRKIFGHNRYLSGDLYTGFIEDYFTK